MMSHTHHLRSFKTIVFFMRVSQTALFRVLGTALSEFHEVFIGVSRFQRSLDDLIRGLNHNNAYYTYNTNMLYKLYNIIHISP